MTASLSRHLVRILDLSAEGARIEHLYPLGIGKRRRLELNCDGAPISLESEIIRSRLERSGADAVFRSALRFVEQEPLFWELLKKLAR